MAGLIQTLPPWGLVALILVLIVLGGALGWWVNNRLGGRSLEVARRRADELLRSARRKADKERKEAVLKARDQIYRERNQQERDLRNRKQQLARREREVARAQQELEQARALLGEEERRIETARAGIQEAEEALRRRMEEADRLVEEQNRLLEQVSGMTQEEARRQLLQNLKAQARWEAASMVKEIKDQAQRRAEDEARKILALAMERVASEFSAERTTFTFQLPEGGNLRGRIIGQEGKNIRAFENVTGIQLLVDEEANTVTLSGFNPVKREIARRLLEELIKDGNIHPRRIEELHRRISKKLDEEMKREGQAVLKELKIRGVHPEITKLLGRLKYRTSYGQNVLLHSKEVAYMTGIMAAELGLDEKLARRAGLLHDIGKAVDYEREGTHPEIGAELGKKYGEPEEVINAIASHHEDCEVTTPISVLVSAADSLSGARPGARRASVAEYIRRIEKLEELANSMEGVEQSYAIQAGREVRVIVRSQKTDDARVSMLASELASRIQSEMDYPGRIKVTVIRQWKAVDYAKGRAAS